MIIYEVGLLTVVIMIIGRNLALSYKNGKDILPSYLLEELQKYIQGELIYIPREENTRKSWGENNGTRDALKERNNEIYKLYKDGVCVDKLAAAFNLSDDSIRKIILKMSKHIKVLEFELSTQQNINIR